MQRQGKTYPYMLQADQSLACGESALPQEHYSAAETDVAGSPVLKAHAASTNHSRMRVHT